MICGSISKMVTWVFSCWLNRIAVSTPMRPPPMTTTFPGGAGTAVLQCLHGQGDVLPVRAGNRQPSRRSASRYNHRVEILQVLQNGFLFHNMDAVLIHLGHQIFVGVCECPL